MKLMDANGQWVEKDKLIRIIVEEQYKALFTFDGPREWGTLLDCIERKVTPKKNNILTRPICDSEVEYAVFQMGSLKTPGPDGFQGIFYQCYWDVISQEVRRIANDFMNGEISPKKLNSTQIVLTPKVLNPETVM